jgi:hypothetical protein
MSTKFGIPLYPVDDAILLDEEGELQPYISENFFHDVFFRTFKNSRWLSEFANRLPDDTKVYALTNSHQGIRTIADCKKILEDEANTQV